MPTMPRPHMPVYEYLEKSRKRYLKIMRVKGPRLSTLLRVSFTYLRVSYITHPKNSETVSKHLEKYTSYKEKCKMKVV